MRRTLGFAVILALTVGWAPSACGQDAREILARVSDAYANLKTYDFNGESQAIFEVDGIKYRYTGRQEMAQGDTAAESMSVQNKRGTIVRSDGSDLPANFEVGLRLPGLESYDFARIGQNVQYAKLLREESQESNGDKAACYVIEVLKAPDVQLSLRAPSPETLWIDKNSYLVLRTAFRTIDPAQGTRPTLPMDWDVAFTSYTLNEGPPQWMVDMKNDYERRTGVLRARMVGTPAPDFDLSGLDGHEVTLASLHDKVVLLDFWATWCGACREELPRLASLEKDWAAEGLVVVRITDESPQDVEGFLKRTKQNFPALVNGESVFKQYGIRGIPTLVFIDRAGKIIAYDVDALSESELTVRLRQVGLEK